VECQFVNGALVPTDRCILFYPHIEQAINTSEEWLDDRAGRSLVVVTDSTDDVTRMAQASSGQWVVVTDAELAEVYGNTGEAQVVSFVPVTDAGRYVTDGILQVRASKDKRAAAQAANEHAFSLLLSGMRNRQVHALVRFVVRVGPRYGLLTADGDMFTIIPAEAVRAARLLPVVEHDVAELDMMSQFIDAIALAEPEKRMKQPSLCLFNLPCCVLDGLKTSVDRSKNRQVIGEGLYFAKFSKCFQI
jgi:hypothetical protein